MTTEAAPESAVHAELLVEELPDGVAVFTINRPQRRNAVNLAVATALAQALEDCDRRPDIRAVVLTGVGGTFSAGLDLVEFANGVRPYVPGRGFAGFVESPPSTPLIAAVEGWALGGGFEMVLACDLVTAGESARFGLPEVARGLVARSGGAFRLARRMPYALAMEVVLTGTPLTATDAARHGLVNYVVPDGEALSAAVRMATQVAQNAPLAVWASKQIMRRSHEWSDDEAFQRQAEYVETVLGSRDAVEGVAAFRERRAPRWTGS